MTTKQHDALIRRARRILASLVVSLNKGVMMNKQDLDQIDIKYIIRCLRHRIDYLKIGPPKSLGLEAFNAKLAEAKVEIEYLETIALKMGRWLRPENDPTLGESPVKGGRKHSNAT